MYCHIFTFSSFCVHKKKLHLSCFYLLWRHTLSLVDLFIDSVGKVWTYFEVEIVNMWHKIHLCVLLWAISECQFCWEIGWSSCFINVQVCRLFSTAWKRIFHTRWMWISSIFSRLSNLSCVNMIRKLKTVIKVKDFITSYLVQGSFVHQFCFLKLFYLVHL